MRLSKISQALIIASTLALGACSDPATNTSTAADTQQAQTPNYELVTLSLRV
ncbi:hypothetical protein [Pseudoalteromonas sp. T1lg23B]|uniref:hypothetical protein n=1 Tax=Pseudoalteromonas sp. T1lg23B TaxID=2077097 RepID=UPI003FA3D53F